MTNNICDIENKVKYASEKSAKKRLKKVVNFKGWHGKRGRTYFCESCKNWHLTSQSAAKEKS